MLPVFPREPLAVFTASRQGWPAQAVCHSRPSGAAASAARYPRSTETRRHQIVFTADEAQAIRDYADQIEPISPGSRDELSLFGITAGRGGRNMPWRINATLSYC